MAAKAKVRKQRKVGKTDAEQSERFEQAARDAGATEPAEKDDKILKRLARQEK